MVPVPIVPAVQPQPEADQPLAELLHAPFKTLQAVAGFKVQNKLAVVKLKLWPDLVRIVHRSTELFVDKVDDLLDRPGGIR